MQDFDSGGCPWLSIVLDILDTQSFANSQAVCRGWLAEARNTLRFTYTHLVNDSSSDLYGHDEAVVALLMLPRKPGLNQDGDMMVSASEDNTMKVWDLQSGANVCTLQGHSSMVIHMACSTDRLFSIGFDHTMCIWCTSSWELLHKVTISRRHDTCFAVAVVRGSDGEGGETQSICVGTERSAVLVWDLHTYTPHKELSAGGDRGESGGAVRALVSHGTKLYSGGDDGRIRVWQFGCRPAAHLLSVARHSHYIVALAATDRLLASGSFDCSVRLQCIDTLEPLATFNGHEKVVKCLTVAGNFIFSGSWDCSIKVWNSTAKVCEGSLTHEETYVNCIAVRGNKLYSGSKQGYIRSWSAPIADKFLHAAASQVVQEEVVQEQESKEAEAEEPMKKLNLHLHQAN